MLTCATLSPRKDLSQQSHQGSRLEVARAQAQVDGLRVGDADGASDTGEEGVRLLAGVLLEGEDQVVAGGDDAADVPLRGGDAQLADLQQQLDLVGQRAVDVGQLRFDLPEVGGRAGDRDLAVGVHAVAVEGDVVLRDVGGRPEVDHGRGQRLDLLVLHLVHGVGQHLAVHLVADHLDVARLLGAEDVARAADLQVAQGDPEARAQVRVFLDGLEPLGGDGRDRARVRAGACRQ